MKREKKRKKNSPSPHALCPFQFGLDIYLFFFNGTHMFIFIYILDPFQLRNKLFHPGFNFIYPNLIFFKYLSFFEIFLKSRFPVSLYSRRLEIRKIFQLSLNLTKFDRVTRFRETNLMTQSVSSSKIYIIF